MDPGRLFWACFVGVAFIAAALAIVTRKLGHVAATLLGVMYGIFVLIVHTPRVAAAPHNANEWTSALVALAFAGMSFTVAGTLVKMRRYN